MKSYLSVLLLLTAFRFAVADEIVLRERIENYFKITGDVFDEYVFVAYPVNTSAGTPNFTFVEIESGMPCKVECDDLTPVIYAISKTEYNPDKIKMIIGQKAGPVIPYYSEISEILQLDYIYVTDVDCYSFVDEGSEIATKEYLIEVAKEDDEIKIVTYEMKAFDKFGNEIEDAGYGFLSNPGQRNKFLAVLSLLTGISLVSVIAIKRFKK